MTPLDQITLNFSPSGLMILNVIVGLIMFGVALDLTPADFRRLLAMPRAVLTGFLSQFVFLPALTFLLVLIIQPPPSIALGMILVAACPGGNVSNFLTHHAGGNTALSVTLTAIATLAAAVMTPFNVSLWGGLYAPAAGLVEATSISFLQMAFIVVILLVLPLLIGMAVNAKWPAAAARLRGPMRLFSMAALGFFIVAALAANWSYFVGFITAVLLLVFVHNAVALAGGYGIATLARLPAYDRRAVTLETGIQNSGLGLVLIFNFYDGLGGMAFVAAWWGVWHILAGFAVATWFRSRGDVAPQEA